MWHDAIDCAPRFIFDVLLKDGSVVEAHHIMGSFETHDGQVLYPEKFRFKECRVVVPVSGMPRNLTKRAADKPSARQGWPPCSQCGSMGYCIHRDPAYR